MNYSYQTSLPAYRDNPEGKLIQKERILEVIKTLGGSTCLKQLERIIGLPQSTLSGRANDLIKDGLIAHTGFVEFEGRKRKRFSLNTNLTLF